jgi:hypothetical protein
MSITITPQKSDSLILVAISVNHENSGSNTEHRTDFQLTDASNNTLIGAPESRNGNSGFGTSTAAFSNQVFLIGESTPATLSAVTYKLRFKVNNASNTGTVRNGSNRGLIYAIEVSA